MFCHFLALFDPLFDPSLDNEKRDPNLIEKTEEKRKSKIKSLKKTKNTLLYSLQAKNRNHVLKEPKTEKTRFLTNYDSRNPQS